ncbi:MAG: hypothetical protein ACK5IN_06945 [Microbacterium sp.]|uniref:hypothetical protein n=1 Tax=Microbacterium sp. TaxID=51671 RepID=UPI003A896B5C
MRHHDHVGCSPYVIDGVIPFPGRDYFDDEDVHDLAAPSRARTAPRRRHRVPVTLLMGAMDGPAFRSAIVAAIR